MRTSNETRDIWDVYKDMYPIPDDLESYLEDHSYHHDEVPRYKSIDGFFDIALHNTASWVRLEGFADDPCKIFVHYSDKTAESHQFACATWDDVLLLVRSIKPKSPSTIEALAPLVQSGDFDPELAIAFIQACIEHSRETDRS